MLPRPLALLAAALLLGAACPPDSGARLVLAASATPHSRALLGPGPGGDAPIPVVMAQVNGVAWPFVLDTGTNLTQLRPDAAAALELPIDPARTTPITGIGGTTRFPNALLRDFQLGRRLWQGISIPVAPGGEDPGRIAGIVGADLLRHAALEIDLSAGRVALHGSPACLAEAPAWPGAETLAAEINAEGLTVVLLQLNGRPARALLDTGAARTVLRQDRIEAFGIPASALRAPPAGTVYGTGSEEAAFRVHEGATLRIGERDRATLPIILAPLPASLPVDMILGQDVLAPRRLWLSYPAGRVTLAPAGSRPDPSPAAGR